MEEKHDNSAKIFYGNRSYLFSCNNCFSVLQAVSNESLGRDEIKVYTATRNGVNSFHYGYFWDSGVDTMAAIYLGRFTWNMGASSYID